MPSDKGYGALADTIYTKAADMTTTSKITIDIEQLRKRIEFYLKSYANFLLMDKEQQKYTNTSIATALGRNTTDEITKLDMLKEGYALLENVVELLTGREIKYAIQFEGNKLRRGGERPLYEMTISLQQLLGAEEIDLGNGNKLSLVDNVFISDSGSGQLGISAFSGANKTKIVDAVNKVKNIIQIQGEQKRMYDLINSIYNRAVNMRKSIIKMMAKKKVLFSKYFDVEGNRSSKYTWQEMLTDKDVIAFFNNKNGIDLDLAKFYVNKGQASEAAKRLAPLMEQRALLLAMIEYHNNYQSSGLIDESLELEYELSTISAQLKYDIETNDGIEKAALSTINNTPFYMGGDVGNLQYKNITNRAQLTQSAAQVNAQLQKILDILTKNNVSEIKEAIKENFIMKIGDLDTEADMIVAEDAKAYVDNTLELIRGKIKK